MLLGDQYGLELEWLDRKIAVEQHNIFVILTHTVVYTKRTK